jgi:hypothetical protein
MKIGVISDTHGYLDEKVFDHFSKVDEVWHAGDVGNHQVLDLLQEFKPLQGVFGNIDGGKVRQSLPENKILQYHGLKVLMTHIAGKPPRYNTRVKQLILQEKPGLLVCGHSHILQVLPDHHHQLLFINPGAAGRHGFHKVRTLLRFDINDHGQVANMEVIELGPRSIRG